MCVCVRVERERKREREKERERERVDEIVAFYTFLLVASTTVPPVGCVQ